MLGLHRKRTKILLICLAAGLAYLCLTLWTGFGIPCPVRTLSGGHIHCPGCGISRAMKSLARLDVADAFYWNPVILSLIPFWITAIGFWLFDRGKRFRSVTVGVSIVVLLLYGIVRNLPIWPLY